MNNDLTLLLKLQSHDNVISEMVQKFTQIFQSIEERKTLLSSLKERLKVSQEAIAKLEMKKKGVENDALSKEALIKKRQSALNSLKDNDAYKAMLGEIETAKRQLDQIEEEELLLMEEIDDKKTSLKDQKKLLIIDEDKIKGEVAFLNGEKNRLDQEMNQKKVERENYARTLPPQLNAQYDDLKSHSPDGVLFPLQQASCGKCGLNCTPSIVNEIRAGKELVLCDCNKCILYWPDETLAEPSPSAKSATHSPGSGSTLPTSHPSS